ncbi:hypothetical protein CsSME_00010902 [Camellia sinensis var. sinensis]
MELQHFSHEHPLILGEVNDDGEAIEMKLPIRAHSFTLQQSKSPTICAVCNKGLRGLYYLCSPCNFNVGTPCAARGQHFSSKHQLMILNEEKKKDDGGRVSCDMEHPMHPEHLLTLLQVVANKFRCDGYDIGLKELIYRCLICNFDLDICCALKAHKLKHESQKHPLSLMSSSASFKCHACGTKREGMSYMCDTCSFWIHKDCASLIPTFKHHNHIHALTSSILVRNIIPSLVDTERESAIKDEISDEANLIHLPMVDDSISAIDLFLKQIRMGDNKREAELKHFSHDHPLTLFDAQGDNNLCYENELLVLNELNKDKICNACVRKILAPFSSCGLCDFFLHKWCAGLPNEVKHLCHPHRLILLKKPLEPRELFTCFGCRYFCNGFAFRCMEMNCSNNYSLDVKCAFLPKAIIHKVHEHPLFIKEECLIFSFGCDICDFNLHYTCVALPDTIKHRYDEHHPFTLIYAPIKDGPDEYICEFCEEEIDPKWWFYHYC